MQYAEGRVGRVCVVRCDHGEDVYATLHAFCTEKKIHAGYVQLLGAVDKARVVVGPKETVVPPIPLWHEIHEGSEVIGVGTIATKAGVVSLHLHTVFSRQDTAFIGCVRENAKAYLVVEAIITEILGLSLERIPQKEMGIALIQPHTIKERSV